MVQDVCGLYSWCMPWSGTSLDLLHCDSTCNYPANYFCTNQFCYWLVIDLMFTCENKAGISFNSSLSLPQDQFIKNGKCNYDRWPHSFAKYICPLTVFTLSFTYFSFFCLSFSLSLSDDMKLVQCAPTFRGRFWSATKKMLEKLCCAPTSPLYTCSVSTEQNR